MVIHLGLDALEHLDVLVDRLFNAQHDQKISTVTRLCRGKCVPKWGAKCVFNLWDEYFVAQRSLIQICYITCAWGFSGISSVITGIQYLLIWTVTQCGLVTQYEYAIGHPRLSLPAVWCQAILCTWTNFDPMSIKHPGPNFGQLEAKHKMFQYVSLKCIWKYGQLNGSHCIETLTCCGRGRLLIDFVNVCVTQFPSFI